MDFLGTTVRREFVQSWIEPSTTPQVETLYPPANEDIFAWIDLLTAVTTAHDRFTMMELGAGYGLWSVRAAKAVEQKRKIPIRIIAVEAEPQHFAWLQLHFRDNGIDPALHTLVEAAVSDAPGTALFYVASPDAEASKPNEWWGQSLIQDHEAVDIVTEDSGRGRPVAVLKSGWQSVEVSKIALRDLLRDCDLIDFVHIDIQREELPAVRSSIDMLDEKVKYLHIGTHSEEIERGLRAILQQHGWQCRADYPGNGKRHTRFGEMDFVDGVQSWANPRLVSGLMNGGCSMDRRHPRLSGVPEALPLGGGSVEVFDTPEAHAINDARLEHLNSLSLDLKRKSVLDVGCGIGHLSNFFVKQGCRVVCVDGRWENIARLRSLYPGLEARVMNVEVDSLGELGDFDVVFCYGLLYHLENPIAALRNMANCCKEFLLLETMVTDDSQPVMQLVDEASETNNQAMSGFGCRPTPAFVAMALSRIGFPFVYVSDERPNFPDFQFEWKNDAQWFREGHPLRCIFVASRSRLENPRLLALLEAPQLQRPTGVTANTGLASQTRSFGGDLERKNFIEVPGALRIENALHVYDRAAVEYDSSGLSVVTSSEPWSYATIIPVEPEAADSIPDDRPVTLEVEAYVDSGELGFGAVHQDCQQIAGEKLIRAAPGVLQTLDIYVPTMRGYIGLLCRNGGLDNTRSRGRIVRAQLSLAPDNTFQEHMPSDLPSGNKSTNHDNKVTGDISRNRSRFSLARACWNQRHELAHLRTRMRTFHEAVADPTSLFLFQYAQLTATALEFQPDLILELGRGYGNSTCAFTEVANRLGGTRVLSLDQWSSNWERTVSRLQPVVPASWFHPLQALQANILTFDFRAALSDARRVLLFWDAHGFEVASVVLSKLLPELANREHLILMHDMCDLRYQSSASLSYGDNELWTGGNNTSRHVKIGFIDSNVEQAVAILDFSTRNRFPLHSADHSLHTDLTDNEADELAYLWGDLFSRYAHWIYFSMSEAAGSLTFPKAPTRADTGA